MGTRAVRLLVAVKALSGKTYPVGTELHVAGTGSSVDGYVDGDWLPLSWWEFAEVERQSAESMGAG